MPADDLRPQILRVSRLRGSLLGLFALGVLSVGLAQCSTSGGTGSAVPKGTSSATPTPTPTPSTLPASATVMIPVGPSPGSGSLGPVLGGYSSTITFPFTETSGTVTVTLSATQPGGTPTVQSMKRRPQTIGGVGLVPLAFMTLTSPTSLTFTSTPSFSFTVPAAAVNAGQIPYLAYYDPTASPQTGWNTFAGPATVNGATVTFPAMNEISGLGSTAGVTYDIVLFTVTSALATPTATPASSPTASPTASPTGSPTSTPTATPTPTPTPSPSPVSNTYEFGLNPAGSALGIPAVGSVQNGTYYNATLGWPPSNASGVLVTVNQYALDDSAPLISGNVYEMTLTPSNGTNNVAPVTFSSSANQLTMQSPMFSLAASYTMIVTGAFNTVTTVPQMPMQGFPGHFLYFPSPFNGLTVANNGTVTVVVHQQ